MAEMTPMMRQYMEIKEQNKDSILFFRLGDFYEMFGDDARKASRELDLTLTTRDKDKNKSFEEKIPMCGIPYHASDAYIARLIAKGYKVAICEQTEDPAKAKGAAHTYALKYYLFEKFTVDQGEDDPDNSDFGAQGKGSGAGGRQQATQGRQGQGSGRLSDAQLARLYKKAEAAGMTKERTNARIVEKYKKQDPATLTRQEYDEICTSLDNAAAQHNQQGGNA